MKLAFKDTLREIYSVILKDLGAYGGFPFFGIVILSFFMIGFMDFTIRLIVSLLAVSIAVILIRFVHFKPRPGQKAKKYNVLYQRIDNSSFPSIHAARAVMLSVAFYSVISFFLPLYVLLTIIVFLSRLHFKRHDWKDVSAGALLGLLLGILFFVI